MSLLPLPWHLLPYPLTVLHVRTTGPLRHADRVCEIAALRVEPDRPPRWLDSRVDPDADHLFTGVPGFQHLIPDLRSMLEGAVVLCHDAGSHAAFLDAELRRLGGAWGGATLCTHELARVLHPRMTAHDLDRLAPELGLPPVERRAFSRARATAGVLRALVERFEDDELLADLIRSAVRIPPSPTRWPPIVGSLVPAMPSRASRQQA
ncbi:MAG: 3'-5' exonuclease [Alphaproteobacteria bacterium]|nr:3'-5' exonuclease [Alphaproteobacteria bacterium]